MLERYPHPTCAIRSNEDSGDRNRYYRNWPTDLVMDAFFGKQNWNATGEMAFKKQLYFSQLGQALVQVRQIHEWRVTNVFGIMFWMCKCTSWSGPARRRAEAG